MDTNLPPATPPPSGSSPVPPPVAPSRTEPLAIVSLVLSILGCVCCGFLLCIPGIICGHLALSKIAREPGLQGRGMAMAGLILGYVGTFFWLIYVVFFGGLAAIQGIVEGMQR